MPQVEELTVKVSVDSKEAEETLAYLKKQISELDLSPEFLTTKIESTIEQKIKEACMPGGIIWYLTNR